MGRPVYTPKATMKTGLYTSGKEWMYAVTLEEYKGMANNVGEKVKLLLDKVDNLEISAAKSTVKKATTKK